MRSVLGLLAVVALAGGCAQRPAGRPPVPPPPTRPPVVQTPPATLAPSARAYVTVASSLDRFVIQASNLAAERVRDPRLRALATQLSNDHFAISAQLSMAGRRLNLLPEGRLLDDQVQRLAALGRAADFDAAYRAEMRRTLEGALRHHQRFAAQGESPTLRPVASFAVQSIGRNLAALRQA